VTLFTWDHSTRRWRASVLPVDRPYSLGSSTMLVPLANARYGVLTSERLRVNGEPILPLRVLDDRDELQRPGDAPCYVSVEDEPEVLPFAGGDGPVRCARCGSAIAAGSPSITCASCHVSVHQTVTLPCWTYAPTCPACPRPTSGRSWEPEPLASPPGDLADDV